jgi:hypothetical protein
MLFAPPHVPVRLEPGEEVVIGRHPECTISIASAQASRRHAVVRCSASGVAVEDLGSTNGTFVNGQPLSDARGLTAGDRIEIGDHQITYCEFDAAAAVPAAGAGGDQTVIAFRQETAAPATGQALEGDLALIPIFAILQMLEMGGQSGRLQIESDQETGHVWLVSGRLVHAASEKATGLEAALAIAIVQTGRFAFAPNEAAPESSFDASVTEVLLESSRLLDEA